MTIIADSLQVIQENILNASTMASGQQNVTLLAVSKAQAAEKIREAYDAGQICFGENYLQEAITKQSLLEDCNIEWHFIGPIQSNKTALIAKHFDWVHSVDRLKVVNRLAAARTNDMPPLNLCIQINSSDEASKSGISVQDVQHVAKAITQLPTLKLRGIMAIPAPTLNIETQHAQFKKVNDIFMQLKKDGFDIDTLSIGMSNDYVAAIQEGATIVRIGSAIFGARQ